MVQVKDGGKWRNKPTPYRVGDEAKAARFAKQTQTILDARLASAEPGNAPLTVATYTERWIDGRRKRGLLSAENENLRLHRHVLPTLGMMKLEDVRPRHVRALVLSLREARKHAPRTILKIYGILRRLFRSAEAEELILTSPCKLEAGILPKNIDADPEWRAGAVFTRHELQRLISEPSIPEDRRLYHAMMGLGGMRPGEPLRARWRHYDPTLEPLGRLLLPKTKTDVPREVPVHATLAFLLGAWKRDGWECTYGRPPTPDDLILPNGRCKRRDDKDAQHTFMEDLENRLGMRRRRRVDLRRTFASLVRSDGANPSIVRTVTHPSPRDILDVYTTFDWPTRCAEVAKLRVSILDGEVVRLGTVLGTVPASTRTPKPKKRNPLPTMGRGPPSAWPSVVVRERCCRSSS